MQRFLVTATCVVIAKDEDAARLYVKQTLDRRPRVERVGDIRVGPLPALAAPHVE